MESRPTTKEKEKKWYIPSPSLHVSVPTYQKKRKRKKSGSSLQGFMITYKKKKRKRKKMVRSVKKKPESKKKKTIYTTTDCSYVVIPHAKTTFVNISSLPFTKKT
jgi:hypothetical protein